MAPLPPNNTARLFFDYVTGELPTSQQHTFQVRIPPGTAAIVEGQNNVLAVLSALGEGSFFDNWRILQVRWAQANSNFSVPVGLISGLVGFAGSGAAAPTLTDEAIEVTFQGRSPTSGRRVDLSLYGIAQPLPPGFRVPATTEGGGNWVSLATQALLGAGQSGDAFLAIDGSNTLWYGYANWQSNSYWEGELRS